MHKCHLSKVCNVLTINIELISIRPDGKTAIWSITQPVHI